MQLQPTWNDSIHKLYDLHSAGKTVMSVVLIAPFSVPSLSTAFNSKPIYDVHATLANRLSQKVGYTGHFSTHETFEIPEQFWFQATEQVLLKKLGLTRSCLDIRTSFQYDLFYGVDLPFYLLKCNVGNGQQIALANIIEIVTLPIKLKQDSTAGYQTTGYSWEFDLSKQPQLVYPKQNIFHRKGRACPCTIL